MTTNPDDKYRYFCKDCRGTLTPQDKTCQHCGADTSEFVEEEDSVDDSEDSELGIVATRYPALRIIAAVYQMIAVLIGILILVLFLLSLQRFAGLTLESVSVVVVGVIGVVSFLALSESIKVFIDIEQNTRATVEILRARRTDADD